MADKMSDLCGAGCVQNHQFVIGFLLSFRVVRKIQKNHYICSDIKEKAGSCVSK
jgi:hypothetical protein